MTDKYTDFEAHVPDSDGHQSFVGRLPNGLRPDAAGFDTPWALAPDIGVVQHPWSDPSGSSCNSRMPSPSVRRAGGAHVMADYPIPPRSGTRRSTAATEDGSRARHWLVTSASP
jgi:hypothetical protein